MNPPSDPWERDVPPYDIAFWLALPHGVLTGVALPGSKEPVPRSVLARLHPDEAELARGLKGYRQSCFVGGRLAAHASIRRLGARQAPLGVSGSGAPQAPPGLSLSISHKSDLAVALVDYSRGGSLGVDLEDLEPPRAHIASKVLTAAERATVEALEEGRRWLPVLLRFSIKESIYKALQPHLERYIGFEEAEVDLGVNEDAQVRLELSGAEGPFLVEARYQWLGERVLTTVRVWPEAAPRGAPPDPLPE